MAEFTKNYNLKKPAQTDFYNVDDFNENMDVLDQAIAEAGANPQLEIDVAETKTVTKDTQAKVGATTDTGGSATAGTVMGKLNALITSLSTHMGRWTAARATKVDTIDTNVSSVKTTAATINTNVTSVKTNVGATTDTGGSATAGTVMGKLNALITSLSTHMGRWTAARATKVDTIDTNVSSVKTTAATINTNVTSVKTNVGAATDSGGSATAGTVMGKANAILTAIGQIGEVLDSL